MMVPDDPNNETGLAGALALFELTVPFTRQSLDARRQALLAAWHPHRYANLTNNPRKYMSMYKKGEAMTKKIEAAYSLLEAWLQKTGAS